MRNIRLLIVMAAALAVMLVSAACQPGDEPAAVDPEPDTPEVADAADDPAETPAEVEAPDAYSEAPALAELVEAGELPPVEERLPEEPMVVDPIDRVGVYGGTWNTTFRADIGWFRRTLGYDGLVRWQTDTQTFSPDEIIPNIARDFEVSEDGREYTFYLREGIKWSDGESFDADDIVFAYEDILLNEELSPSPPRWLVAGDEPAELIRVDDYTVTFRFVEPYGMFLQELGHQQSVQLTATPRHYFEQFHVDYNPDIDALIAEEGANDWVELMEMKGSGYNGGGISRAYWQGEEIPTVFAWMVTTGLGEGSHVVAERNPYYWKVDPEGKQLPYLDGVSYEVVQDTEVEVFKALNGELDLYNSDLANKPVFIDNQEVGNYHLIDTVPTHMNTMIVSLNLTHEDPVMREIFQNKDFRIGLSHAIDRQEIIDIVYVSQGEPWQAAPRPESPFYNEEMAKQYTEFDVELANEYLDDAGYAERDGEGFRLGPDRERITFNVSVINRTQHWVDSVEMVTAYWQDVGIDARMDSSEESLFRTRKNANEHDVAVWGGDGGLEVLVEPRWYFPFSGESNYAIPWARWFTGDSPSEEPPDIVKQQMDLYGQVQATPDADEQFALMQEILEIAADQFYVIGISLRPPDYYVVKNDLHNVPDPILHAWVYPTPGPTNPFQYFKEG